jgi:hypothetical protein
MATTHKQMKPIGTRPGETAPLPKRLYYLKQSGVYRQKLLDNIGLLVATVLKRI